MTNTSSTTFVAKKPEKKHCKIVKFEQEDGNFEIKKRFLNKEEIEKKFPEQFHLIYENESITGTIANFHENSYGTLMFLTLESGDDVMIPLHTDLEYKLRGFEKKTKVEIKYLGRKPSPKDSKKTLFKFEATRVP
ncbi:hypothetical protein [Fluviispira vulneris]|uniref:hypothetical protein n=1 Tax=Fluviispira vulneris TaxID=2763012 RepID=UPI0016485597|nr:hypothetical protein [Fluviispira vulneris]